MEKLIFDWTECINQIKNGDDQAFVFLYSKTYDRLKKRVLVKTGFNEQDSEDLVQEIFITAYQKIGTLREPNAVLTWLDTICDNTCMAYLRKNARRAGLADIKLESELASDDEDIDNFSFDSIASEELGVEAQIEQKEVQRILAEIISDLPPMQCQCIELQLAEKSIKEIAQITQIPENTVKTHIFNAKKRIKAKVEELENKGTKLYGLAPLPFFYYIFRMFMGSKARVPSNAAAAASEIIGKATVGTGIKAGASVTGTGAAAAAEAGKAAAATGAAAGIGAGKIAAIIAAGIIGLAGIGTGAAIIARNHAAPETAQATEYITEETASQDTIEETTEPVTQETTQETTEETTEAEVPVTARAAEAYIQLLEDISAEYDEARNLIETSITDTVPLWNIILKDIDGDGVPEMVYTTIESNSGSTYVTGVEGSTFNYTRQAVHHLVTYIEETGEVKEILSEPYCVFNELDEGTGIVVGNTDVYYFDGDDHLYSLTYENISHLAVELTEYSINKADYTLIVESQAEGLSGEYVITGQPSENMQKLMDEGTSGCELLFGSGTSFSSLGSLDLDSAVKYLKDLAEYGIEDVTAELQSDMLLAKTLALDTDPDRSPYNIHDFMRRAYELNRTEKWGYYNSNDIVTEKEFLKQFFYNYRMDFFDYDLYPANVELTTFDGQGPMLFNYISESDLEWLIGNILNISQDHFEEIKRSIESGELSLYGNDVSLQDGMFRIGFFPYAWESYVLDLAVITKADRINDIYYITVKTNWHNDDFGISFLEGVVNLRMAKKTVDGQEYWTFLSYDYYEK